MALVTVTFKNGVSGVWSWSLAAPGEESSDIFFYGTEGTLRDTTGSRFSVFHLFERRPDQREAGHLQLADGRRRTLAELEQEFRTSIEVEERDRLFAGDADDGFALEIWDFLETVRGNRPTPEVDGWGGMKSLAIGAAVYESALTGDVVQVDDILDGTRDSFQRPIDEHWGLV